jgi:hypothetical protein
MNNLINPVPKMTYTPIAAVNYTVSAGAAGYVDTDVSATTGIDTERIWCVTIATTIPLFVAVRPNGSAIDSQAYADNSTALHTYVSSAGHVDLLRAVGGDIFYRFVGYLA